MLKHFKRSIPMDTEDRLPGIIKIGEKMSWSENEKIMKQDEPDIRQVHLRAGNS